MSDLESAVLVEVVVKEPRHQHHHLGRVVSDESRLYILHSKDCQARSIDIRECEFSKALDRGVDPTVWRDALDVTVVLVINTSSRTLEPSGV